MDTASSVLSYLATCSLGLSAGALLAEARVLVPFWRTLEPAAFLAWYRENATLLLRFFGPLEAAAALLAIAAWALGALAGAPALAPLGAAALLSVAVLLAFPLYFQRVNASFASGSIALHEVAPELRRWSRWHGARTALAVLAFALAAAGR